MCVCPHLRRRRVPSSEWQTQTESEFCLPVNRLFFLLTESVCIFLRSMCVCAQLKRRSGSFAPSSRCFPLPFGRCLSHPFGKCFLLPFGWCFPFSFGWCFPLPFPGASHFLLGGASHSPLPANYWRTTDESDNVGPELIKLAMTELMT